MEFPIDRSNERHFVGVDLADFETRNLAPGSCGVVPILQILGSKHESCEEHSPAALHRSRSKRFLGLLGSKVVGWDIWLHQNQVIKSDLQRRVACL